MYSDSDLEAAVAAGALSPDAASALRDYVAGRSGGVAVDEEHFRLITGFNDIFVAIAAAILLFAVGWIGQAIGGALGLTLQENFGEGPSPLAPLAIAATAWGLALFFTAKRRMALPSILLLLAFVGGIFVASAFSLALIIGEPSNANEAIVVGAVASVSGLIAAGAAWLHWRRFKVPITVAAGAGAVAAIAVGIVIATLGDTVGQSKNLILMTFLLLGIGVFLFAMRWDSSDPSRVTRRSDVAFWLHLLAAPMIVHPVFSLLGLTDGSLSIGGGILVVALYVVIGLTALAIDRRALLVSALAYVLYALTQLFKQLGAVELNIALTALLIGSALLLLSAYWHQARRMVVKQLPEALQSKLPMLDRPVSPLPAA
jgi:uncharacterized membrane protein YfcA